MNEHYAAVLSDLRERRAALEAEIRELDAALAGIQRVMGAEPAISAATIHRPRPYPDPQPSVPSAADQNAPHKRFANISVRWAVLWHLAEFAPGFQKTGEIARAILAGGYNTSAEKFPNMVSAVLSAMKTKGEVETDDAGGYQLTEDGKRTWNLIRQGNKFRLSTSTNEPPLLSVQ